MQTRAVQDTAQCLVSDRFRLWAELVRQVVSEQSWPQRRDFRPLQRNFGPVGDSVTSHLDGCRPSDVGSPQHLAQAGTPGDMADQQ